jgi:hypothetical protein
MNICIRHGVSSNGPKMGMLVSLLYHAGHAAALHCWRIDQENAHAFCIHTGAAERRRPSRCEGIPAETSNSLTELADNSSTRGDMVTKDRSTVVTCISARV